MIEDGKKDNKVLEISPEREVQIWEHLLGLKIDRFSKDGVIDVTELQEYLEKNFGPLFADRSEKFSAILRRLSETVDGTKAAMRSLLCEPLCELRAETSIDYPTFETSLRVLNQDMNGFVPLTENKMVSYQLDGDFIHLHIQPSYSVAEKSGTIEKAMSTLAKELENAALGEVKKVAIDSWLVVDRPARWEQLGFVLDPDREGFARVSVEEFKKRWS